MDYCGPYTINQQTNYCSKKYIKWNKLKEDFEKECIGKDNCQVNLVSYLDLAIEKDQKCSFTISSLIYAQFECTFDSFTFDS